jgi:hypothetical protein
VAEKSQESPQAKAAATRKKNVSTAKGKLTRAVKETEPTSVGVKKADTQMKAEETSSVTEVKSLEFAGSTAGGTLILNGKQFLLTAEDVLALRSFVGAAAADIPR